MPRECETRQEVEATERGDVLIFVSGAGEIATVAEYVSQYGAGNGRWIVLPLHSGLSVDEQDRCVASLTRCRPMAAGVDSVAML